MQALSLPFPTMGIGYRLKRLLCHIKSIMTYVVPYTYSNLVNVRMCHSSLITEEAISASHPRSHTRLRLGQTPQLMLRHHGRNEADERSA